MKHWIEDNGFAVGLGLIGAALVLLACYPMIVSLAAL